MKKHNGSKVGLNDQIKKLRYIRYFMNTTIS